MKTILIKLSSYDINILEIYSKKITSIVGANIIRMPTKKRKYTLLKGPHGDKKARAQFEKALLNRLFTIKGSNKAIITTIKYIEKTLIAGIYMKVKIKVPIFLFINHIKGL